MHGPQETIKRKVQRDFTPGRLFDRSKACLGEIAQRDAGCGNRRRRRSGRHRKSEKTLVVDCGEIETEAPEVIRQEQGALNLGVDGVAKSVGKGKTESE